MHQISTQLLHRVYHGQRSALGAASPEDLATVMRVFYPGIRIARADLHMFTHALLFQHPIENLYPVIRKDYPEVLTQLGENVSVLPIMVCKRGDEWRRLNFMPT